MKYLLLSVLVVLVAVMAVPDAFAAVHTDPDNRFSIEYPSGWIKEVTDAEFGDIWITDKYNWNAGIGVINYFGSNAGSFAGMSDSAILEKLKVSEMEFCNSLTYQVDGFICYNYQLVSSSIFLTEQNKSAYFVNQIYTKQYEDPEFPGEYIMQSTVMWVLDGDNYAEIYTEMDDFMVNTYFDTLLTNSLSYKLLQDQPVTQPAPISCLEGAGAGANCIWPYFGAIVELDKVYYSSEDDVNIVITVPNFNANPNVIEYIGTDANSRVTIITSQGTLDFYKLKETGVDTGVFEGSISLNSVSTTGMGPWSGNIKTSNKDTITVQFSNTYSGNVDTVKAQGFVEGPSVTTPTPTPPTESVTSIPHWIKNNAEWWADGIIDDSSFLQGIEYLINEGIIVIPPTTTSGASGSQEVPAWVKKNASWWGLMLTPLKVI